MTTDTVSTPRATLSPLMQRLLAHWPLLAGLLVLMIGTLPVLASNVWNTESGAHGPLVLVTGLWLLWHEAGRTAGPAGMVVAGDRPFLNGPLMALATVVVLSAWVFGRAFDFLVLEAAGLYLAGLIAYAAWNSWATIRANLLTLIYLGFIVPPPGWLLDRVTMPLQHFVSASSAWLAGLIGLPISRSGVTMQVGPYQLLVEDACSGLNSIVGLFALAIFYAKIMHDGRRGPTIVLLLATLPIAIAANIVRVLALILVTYYFGNEAGQGLFHDFAGLFLFAVALMMLFGVDALYKRFVPEARDEAA